ncbi:Fic family protein [Nocardia camponoti]|uniref:Cell division protein Fic n=1 Tax=Nocardia camponoti TaxID=1616106 RepID=A0A917Q7G6_9NOCA|nr:Fic family protein [Nocardia camponoti]GGK32868.1 cell division protein Fic [Nocardia camponoti]
MLYSTPALADRDRQVLGEVDDLREQLRRRVQGAPAKWTAVLRKSLTADAVAASNSIEGFKVSAIDVEDLIAGESDVDVSDENRAETLAYQHLMTYLQTQHDAPDFQFSKGQLNALHWMLQGHRHTARKPAGQWRAGPVYVTDPGNPRIAAYTAPDADIVADLMSELIDWLNAPTDDHPLVRAAMAHLHLVSIHPWCDGNGRMSRSLQTLMIARAGVIAPEFSSIEAWLGRSLNTWEYYKVLGRLGPSYQPDGDATEWLRFNLLAYHQQAQTVRARFDQSSRVWAMLEGSVADERMVSALHDVAVSGRVRRSRYGASEGLSVQQAQRDLKALAQQGVLAPVGRTRARYYIEGDNFPADVLEVARRPFSLVDPYRR